MEDLKFWRVLGDNVGTKKKDWDTVTDACREAGVEVNASGAEYVRVLLSRRQNAQQSHDGKMGNQPIEGTVGTAQLYGTYSGIRMSLRRRGDETDF
jgi:hypothetical protein